MKKQDKKKIYVLRGLGIVTLILIGISGLIFGAWGWFIAAIIGIIPMTEIVYIESILHFKGKRNSVKKFNSGKEKEEAMGVGVALSAMVGGVIWGIIWVIHFMITGIYEYIIENPEEALQSLGLGVSGAIVIGIIIWLIILWFKANKKLAIKHLGKKRVK